MIIGKVAACAKRLVYKRLLGHGWCDTEIANLMEAILACILSLRSCLSFLTRNVLRLSCKPASRSSGSDVQLLAPAGVHLSNLWVTIIPLKMKNMVTFDSIMSGVTELDMYARRSV